MRSSIDKLQRTTVLIVVLCCTVGVSYAQTKVGYVATQVIRERFPEAQQAEQRIKTMTEEWKKELEDKQRLIAQSEDEIRKNRLIWSDEERRKKEAEKERLKTELEQFSADKFGPGGDFDKIVRDMYKPIEEKIAAAVEAVSRAEGYDIIWDKSTHPLVYVNPRYDITIKVMERLEIPVEDLKAQYEEKLKDAPAETREKPKRKRRVRRRPSQDDTKSNNSSNNNIENKEDAASP